MIAAFHHVADHLPCVLLLVSANGRIKAANPRAADRLQLSTPVDGSPLAELIEVPAKRVVAFLERCLRADRPPKVRWRVGPAGDAHVRGSRYPNGAGPSDALVLVQIQWPKACRGAEWRLSALVNHSDDAIVEERLDGTITRWNPAAQRLFGYHADEAVGRPITLLMPPERAADAAETLRRVKRGETVSRYETVRRRKDGSLVQVCLSVSPVRDRKGHVVGAIEVAREIPTQERAERQVYEASDLLRTFIDKTADAVFVKDVKGRYLLFNEAAARFVGKAAEEVIGKDDTEVFDPENALAVMEADQRVMRGGVTEVFTEVLTAAGVRRCYSSIKSPFRDERGEVIGLIGICREVTGREQTEASLEASEQRFSSFMRHLPGLAWIKDSEGRYVYVNDAALKAFGVTRSGLLGRTDEQLFPAPTAAQFRENDRQASRSGKALQFIETLRHQDGGLRESLVCKFLIPLEAKPMVGGIAIDVTQAREAERALRLRDRAMQATTQGIVIADPTRPGAPVLYANPGYERLTGYAAGEVVGRDWTFLHGKDTDPVAVRQVIDAVRQSRNCSVEMLNYRKDGTPFWNSLSVSPVYDELGAVIHLVGVMTDATERRRLQEQYIQAQKMEVIGQLASGVAHDFNNLLVVIGGYGGLVLNDLPADKPAREWVRQMVRAGERAAGLTRQLLAFSRKRPSAPAVLDVNALLAGLGGMLRQLIGEGVELTLDAAPGLWLVKADAGQLEQVIGNLVVNARDALGSGGHIAIETGNVANGPDGLGPSVRMRVRDDGCGMTDDVLARIFEPFYTTKESGKGTGLGLAMVLSLVEGARGRVRVRSKPGEGTAFDVYLPRTQEAPEVESATPTSALGGGETLLLVEDDVAVRGLAALVLVKSGYAVLTAGNGDEALRVAEAHSGPIDLVVTDVVMPGKSGPALVKELESTRSETIALYLSGYPGEEMARHGLSEATNFLHKPYSPAQLALKVRQTLDAAGLESRR